VVCNSIPTGLSLSWCTILTLGILEDFFQHNSFPDVILKSAAKKKRKKEIKVNVLVHIKVVKHNSPLPQDLKKVPFLQ